MTRPLVRIDTTYLLAPEGWDGSLDELGRQFKAEAVERHRRLGDSAPPWPDLKVYGFVAWLERRGFNHPPRGRIHRLGRHERDSRSVGPYGAG